MDALYESDLSSVSCQFHVPRTIVDELYNSWKHRLTHPHFGLNTFFIAQNASVKLAVRVLSSFISRGGFASIYLSFATAVLLRYLTPVREVTSSSTETSR